VSRRTVKTVKGAGALMSTDTGPDRPLLPTRAAQLAAIGAGAVPPAAPVPAAPASTDLATVDAGAVGPVTPIDLDALVTTLAERMGSGPRHGHTLSRFSSLSDFARAARNGDEDAIAAFAIADQITGDNPGVVPPGWLTDVKRIIDRGSPAITALGGPAPLPDAGMDLNWPYFAGDLSTIVGVQATQKTDVTSVVVSILKGNKSLKTFAGGSDVSWQLIERSDPSYIDAYLRILAAAYAVVTDNDFADDLFTAATAGQALDFDTATASVIKTAVFAASSAVRTATGAPASVILAAPDVFAVLGGKDGIYPVPYGTQNVAGTADAASLRVDISGLPVTEVPGMALGFAVVTNDLAARWHGSGAMFASAEDVTKLGRDVVVWGMGATAIYAPAGVIKLGTAPV
jgi:hypothetical protein